VSHHALDEAAVIDLETLPIEDRPRYPPAPVGVALRVPGSRSRYLAWGHTNGQNNCTWSEARQAVGELYDSQRPLLFHHAKFDVEVLDVHLGLPVPAWDRIHDTLPMLFLRDPRASTYGLKPSAETILGLPPEEKDAVIAWLLEHQPVPGRKLSPSPKSDHYAGAFIAYAPPSVVGPYAIGDVDRTWRLAKKVYQELDRRGMLAAYERERRLLPIVIAMEQQGVRLDVKRLTQDVELYTKTLDRLDAWLRHRLKTPGLNINSGDALVAALIKAGVATTQGLGWTEGGKDGTKKKVQSNKEALEAGVTDPAVLGVLRYRSQLKTRVGTFMGPWLETAKDTGGLVYTSWNSTRTDKKDGMAGARTGRFSASLFMNTPKEVEPIFKHEARDAKEAKDLVRSPLELPPQPLVRGYVVPYYSSHVLLDRDYSQQELRILGHFEDAVLKQAYLDNPWLDVHEHARTLINNLLQATFERKPIKNTGFGIIYGMGLGLLAAKSKTTVEMAKRVRDAYLAIFPGLKEMYTDIKQRVAQGLPVRTWGGREYYCEEPKLIDGRIMKFDYKLLNVIVQGSAADCTKEAIIRYWAAKPKHHLLISTVHDELLTSVPRVEMREAMRLLRECMESIEFDVPMLSEGAWSPTSWAALEDYDVAGEIKLAA
jgi:DNA polymerase-1